MTILAYDFAADLVCRRSLPALGLEVKDASLARCPVLDFHGTIVVNGGVTSNDTHDGGSDLLPSVKLLSARGWAKSQEPRAKRVEFERLAVELRLDGRFAVVVPVLALCVSGTDRRVMADLLDEEAVPEIWANVLIGFTKKRVEGFGNAADGGCILGCGECSNVDHTLHAVSALGCNVQEVGVFHIFDDTVEERCRLVEGHGKSHLRHVFANHRLEDSLLVLLVWEKRLVTDNR